MTKPRWRPPGSRHLRPTTHHADVGDEPHVAMGRPPRRRLPSERSTTDATSSATSFRHCTSSSSCRHSTISAPTVAVRARTVTAHTLKNSAAAPWISALRANRPRAAARSEHDRCRPPPNRRPTSEPVARQACTRPRPPVRQRPPSPRPPSPSDRRARDRATPAPTCRSSPRTSPPTRPPWPSSRVTLQPARHRLIQVVLAGRRDQRLIARHRRQHPRLDLTEVSPHQHAPGLGGDSRPQIGRQVVQSRRGRHPARRTVAARPRTPQPPADDVLVQPSVPVRGGDPLGLAPRQQRLDDGMDVAKLFEPTRPRVRHVDPDAPQHRPHVGRIPQVDRRARARRVAARAASALALRSLGARRRPRGRGPIAAPMIRSASTTSNGSPRAGQLGAQELGRRLRPGSRQRTIRIGPAPPAVRRCSSAAASASCAHLATRSGDAVHPPLVHSGRRCPSARTGCSGSSASSSPRSRRPPRRAGRVVPSSAGSRPQVRATTPTPPAPTPAIRRATVGARSARPSTGRPPPRPRPARRRWSDPTTPTAAPTRPRSQQPTPPGPCRTNHCAAPHRPPTPSPSPSTIASTDVVARPDPARPQPAEHIVSAHGPVQHPRSSLARPPRRPHWGRAVRGTRARVAHRRRHRPSAPRRSPPSPPSCARQPRTRSEPRSRSPPATRSKGGSASAGRRSPTSGPSPASEATLTIDDVHDAIDALAAIGGGGSVARRRELLHELLAKATEPEQQMIRAILGGELRQGALDGVMAAAVAKAAGRLARRGPARRHVRRIARHGGSGRPHRRQRGLGGDRAQPDPSGAADARLARRQRRRRARRDRAGLGRVEARRRPHPGPPRWPATFVSTPAT